MPERNLWVSYPAFNRYYEDTKTASALLSRLRIALGVRYLGVAFGFSFLFVVTCYFNMGATGFTFTANGRFGFGARTGGFTARTIVDDIAITLR